MDILDICGGEPVELLFDRIRVMDLKENERKLRKQNTHHHH